MTPVRRLRRTILHPALSALFICAALAVAASTTAADDAALPDRLTSANQTDTRDPAPGKTPTPAEKLPPIANQRPLAQVGPNDTLYEANGVAVSRADWEARVRLAAPYFASIHGQFETNFSKLPPMNYVRSIEEALSDAEAGRMARELGLELSDNERKALEGELKAIEYRLWMLETGVAKDIDPSNDDLRAFYEKHKEEYLDSSQLNLKTIFISTYKNYTVVEGDTLEKLAERFPAPAGSDSTILSLATRSPRADSIDRQPLTPGEELLVPVDATGNAAAEARIREAHKRLLAGEKFDDLAKEYSTNANPTTIIIVRPEEDTRPMNPAIKERFMALADGEVSEPFQSRHGWQLIQRLGYTPTKPKPIEALSTGLYTRARNERLAEKWQAHLAKLWAAQTLFTVDEEVLAKAHLDEARDLVLVTGPDVKITAGDFRQATEGVLSADTPTAKRLELVSNLGPVQSALGMQESTALGIVENPHYKLAAKRMEDKFLGEVYLRRRADELVKAPTEVELAAAFAEERANLEATPSAELWQLSVPIDYADAADETARNKRSREMVQQLAAKLKEVTTREQFAAKVAELSDDELKAAEGHVGWVNRFEREGLYARAIESKSGSVYGPVPSGGRLYAWWIGDKKETAEVMLEDVRSMLDAQWRQRAAEEKVTAVREELIAKAGLRLHFAPKPETPAQ